MSLAELQIDLIKSRCSIKDVVLLEKIKITYSRKNNYTLSEITLFRLLEHQTKHSRLPHKINKTYIEKALFKISQNFFNSCVSCHFCWCIC